MTNIITVQINQPNGVNMTPFRYKYDYGQILKIEGIDLPQAYEVHFANQSSGGTTVTQIGNADGVTVPDALFLTGSDIFAFLFLHTGNDDGETVIKIQIPIKDRPQPSDDVPTPVEQSAITQAIAALNQAVEQTAADVVQTGRDVLTTAENVRLAGLAQEGAEAAQRMAESARDLAEGYRNDAQGYASQAAGFAQTASGKADDAAASAASASQSAQSAYQDAERAEQAAANAGYMYFYIDENGDLIYQRTTNTQVDFYLSEGDLYVKAVQ